MHRTDWKHKFQISNNFETIEGILSGNSMGICFEFKQDASLCVHFKPLNETFKVDIHKLENATLLNFERDLIDEDDIEYALDIMTLFNKYPQWVVTNTSEIEQLKKVIHLLEDEYQSDAASYIMLKTLLKVLMLHLIRYQNDGFLEQDLNQKRVFQFLELMETHFLNETNSSFYAETIGVSSKRLNQILKEKLNLTAKQIIQQRQITEAKRRLVRSEISPKELAFELGFDSQSSFSRFFKKNVGVSPSTFKKHH
ncbi:helix-turn-helix domain-containing protein [Winogradskyella psychrotolerans]|uniref:helix-turn-helix domain-containing protein n=1 Tax=Winogradskyella psychrotolerans TaxID=1344585 RepID=UPI001C068E0C|nr:helix-turn-helix domain-containing protein [Winogradskyella psychrotolerans]MBU2928747.1 helix-turn-helix domain-containing protein [Winogradskyella psychrotolerans]